MYRKPRNLTVEYLTFADERTKALAAFGARKAIKTIPGFGRDWSRGIRNPALRIPLQEVCPAQQQELLLTA